MILLQTSDKSSTVHTSAKNQKSSFMRETTYLTFPPKCDLKKQFYINNNTEKLVGFSN